MMMMSDDEKVKIRKMMRIIKEIKNRIQCVKCKANKSKTENQ